MYTRLTHQHFTFWETENRTISLTCRIELRLWKPVKINPPALWEKALSSGQYQCSPSQLLHSLVYATLFGNGACFIQKSRKSFGPFFKVERCAEGPNCENHHFGYKIILRQSRASAYSCTTVHNCAQLKEKWGSNPALFSWTNPVSPDCDSWKEALFTNFCKGTLEKRLYLPHLRPYLQHLK